MLVHFQACYGHQSVEGHTPALREYKDLEPQTPYRLWAGPSAEGWYVLADIGPEATHASVVLRQGGTIRGQLLLPPEASAAGVRATEPGVMLGATASIEDGTFVLQGLPEGSWQIEAWSRTGEGRREVTRTIQEGDVPGIDLTGC